MESFFETIVRLDTNDDIPGLLDFIQHDSKNTNEILLSLGQLFSTQQIRPAYILAMLLANQGIQNPIIAMALSVGGLLYNNQEEKMRGLRALYAHTSVLTPEHQTLFYEHIIAPTITHLLNTTVDNLAEDAQVLRILEILKAADPRCQTMFDWDAPVPNLSPELLRQQGRAQARLVSYKLPPPGTIRQQRRVLVTGRETFFLKPSSRLMDFGPRDVASMNAYGWYASLHAMSKPYAADECYAIVDACRQINPDILFLDDEVLIRDNQARTEMLAQIRQENPSLKVVGYFLDAWSCDPNTLLAATALLDLVWDPVSPSSPVWNNPAFTNKIVHLPHPTALSLVLPSLPLLPEMLFAGGISLYNWHRSFWLAATNRLQLPIKKQVSTHRADGLPPLESYALYMSQLAAATCCLNLTMRPDPDYTRIVTGRSFDTILSGSLLVQETSPSMHYFFIPGEHYLEFSTMAELSAIARFITEKKEEAEEIRRCGYHFAHEQYNDQKLIGYIDKALYFPD